MSNQKYFARIRALTDQSDAHIIDRTEVLAAKAERGEPWSDQERAELAKLVALALARNSEVLRRMDLLIQGKQL